MKRGILSLALTIQIIIAWAQDPALKGSVVDAKTQQPLSNVMVLIQSTRQTTLTDTFGSFFFLQIPKGKQLLQISSMGYGLQNFPLEIREGESLDLGVIALEEDVTSERQLSLITLTESDLGDDNSGSESTSGLLQATRDVYQQAAAFQWGQARFRIRGLENEYGTTMINGVVMNKLYDGRPQWSNWGGLNDVTRNQEFTTGSAPSDFTFGGILGTQEINTRASHYRSGSRISFSVSNTNYTWRTMGTHVSGLRKNGWAYVISGSKRWAQEGYFEGTNYAANSLFSCVEKKINPKHSLNFTAIYAQNSRGKNSPNTKEVTQIAGTNYNSYWGWQDGKKRNSRDKDIAEPIVMLSHFWKINEKNALQTTVAFQTGRIGNSRIDFQNANNPDPAYYRYLPSYHLSLFNTDPAFVNQNNPNAYLPGGLGGIWTPNLNEAASAEFLTQRQINWDYMYQANSVTNSGNSVYVLYQDRTNDSQWNGSSVLQSQLSDNSTLNAGVNFRHLKSHNHKYLLDLLGGKYYKDYNPFGTNAAQSESDLNNPGRTVGVGDSYGYNYHLFATSLDAFTQFKFTYSKIDFYLAQNYTRNDYQREGLYRNGYYPANSFGKSRKVGFDSFGFKGGLTYKMTGKHLFVINGVRMSKAPTLRTTFPNARLNNNSVVGLRDENISSVDVGYVFRSPTMKVRLTAFYATTENTTETSFFYADGITIDDGNPDTEDASSNFVAETVMGINKKNFGSELGFEYQITATLKTTIATSFGQYTYTNNPNVFLNVDALGSVSNSSSSVNYGESKMKDYKQPGMPQTAAAVGMEYRDPKYWWIGINANYLANSYLDIAPVLRTANFLKNPESPSGQPFPEVTEGRTRELLQQEKLTDITLVHLTGGKSWRLKKQTIGFFAAINNVFDLVYKTGGYEQARNASYRELNQDVSSGYPSFGPKYFYGYGRNYFINLFFNF